MVPDVPHYWLQNAHVPTSLLRLDAPDLLSGPSDPRSTLLGDELAYVDIEIADGLIGAITPAGQGDRSVPGVDLRRKQVWPCFVDLHTHLDKGHIWERTPNPDRTFEGALQAVQADSQKFWQADDVYRRMEFGLKCSYAHGTHAIRTHLDSFGEQGRISLEVFQTLQREWADRITLQAVSLVALDYFFTPAGETLADGIAATQGGYLGGVTFPNPDLDAQLDRVMALARDRQVGLDFHTDESGDARHQTLRQIGEAVLRNRFDGPVVCGHCCSLAVQSPDEVQRTIEVLKAARIGVVSLPLCNLYLQDRQQQASQTFQQTRPPSSQTLHTGRTPRWRGVTLLHELRENGIPVAIASDNCRDPFHGFGDHDALEVFNLSVRIGHLDNPYGNWPRAITTTPADLMLLPQMGRIGGGLPADLVIFNGRTFSEVLARSQRDRTVLRRGRAIDTTLPDYADLDDLMAR
ncbi:MAG: cytosine deaminase [Synechococcales bacterium]|nr:cytosine deaminase [Synechococcales bacterium]